MLKMAICLAQFTQFTHPPYSHSDQISPFCKCLSGLGQADCIITQVIDTVVSAQEDVTEDD